MKKVGKAFEKSQVIDLSTWNEEFRWLIRYKSHRNNFKAWVYTYWYDKVNNYLSLSQSKSMKQKIQIYEYFLLLLYIILIKFYRFL